MRTWAGLSGLVAAVALAFAPVSFAEEAKAAGAAACETCMCGTSVAEGKAEVGQPAPAFTLKSSAGQTVSLADHAGKIVVLHWQSVNCPWDVAYQPYLNAIAAKYADQDVVFVGINSNVTENPELINGYTPDAGITYPILMDAGNKLADVYGAQTTPHMYVIDGDGVLRYMGGIEAVPTMQTVGQMDEQYLEPVLDALIAGTEPAYTTTTSKGCSIKRAS